MTLMDGIQARYVCCGFSLINFYINSNKVGRLHYQVTSMEGMFHGAIAFNQPISSWDVSRVETMEKMFSANGDAMTFNQPLDTWDVSNVLTMDVMFNTATQFNQPLSSWDVSRVESMFGLFINANTFNQPLSSWTIDRVTNLMFMFSGASAFNQDLCPWSEHWNSQLSSGLVSSMFGGSNCTSTASPQNAQGPWCHICT